MKTQHTCKLWSLMYLLTPALIASNVASSAPTTSASCGDTFHRIVLGRLGFFSFFTLASTPPVPLPLPLPATAGLFFPALVGAVFALWPAATFTFCRIEEAVCSVSVLIWFRRRQKGGGGGET